MTKAELEQENKELKFNIDNLFNLLFTTAGVLAKQKNYRHLEWDIEYVIPVIKKNGESLFIVIGNRHTEFQPYVAWHWFGDDNFAWGHYCQTEREAQIEAMDKLKNEFGIWREM